MSRLSRLVPEAIRTLRANRQRTFLMMSGVAVAVGVLASVIVFAQGAREEILTTVRKHGLDMVMIRAGGDVQVFAPRADRGLASLMDEDAAAIRRDVPRVTLVSPVQNQRGITVVAGDRSVMTRGFGVGTDWMEIRRWGVAEGEFLTREDEAAMARVTLLGARVARELFPEGDAVGSTVRVNGDPFTVKGVFIEMGASAGGDDWDDRIVMPYTTTMRRVFNRPYLEQIVLRVSEARHVDAVADEIRALLRMRHSIAPGAPDDFFVREPEDVEGAALETSSTLSALLIGVALVALLAGGIVILNLMLLSVSQRTHEIGLRRALGARQADITRQFLAEALLVSMGGGLTGLALAGLAAFAAATFGLAPIAFTPIAFVAAFLACAVLGVAFGLPPARRAAALDPSTALRERRL